MTDEAKILKAARETQNLDIRTFADRVNDFLPEPFGYSYATYSKWERGKSALPYYVFDYLACRAAGWVQEMARAIVKEMHPQVVEASQRAGVHQGS